MKDPDKAIVCGTCNVPIVCPSDPEPHHQMICPRCGARDTFEEVWKVCMDHVKHRLQSIRKGTLRGGRTGTQSAAPGAPANNGQEPLFKWRFRD